MIIKLSLHCSLFVLATARRVTHGANESVALEATGTGSYPTKCGFTQSCCCYLTDYKYSNPNTPREIERLCWCSTGYCPQGLTPMTDSQRFCPALPWSAALESAVQETETWTRSAKNLGETLRSRGRILDGIDAAVEALENGKWWERWMVRQRESVTKRVASSQQKVMDLIRQVGEHVDEPDAGVGHAERLEGELARAAEEASTDMVEGNDTEEGDSDIAGLAASLRNLSQCLRSSACRRSGGGGWAPALHVVGYSTWTAFRGIHGTERVVDFSTMEAAEFRYRGINVGSDFVAMGGSLYSGFGWKGELQEESLAKAYSGPFVALSASAGLIPTITGSAGFGASIAMSANEKYVPRPKQVKTVTFSFGGSLLRALPGLVGANGVATNYEYTRGRCFATSSEFFRYLWNGGNEDDGRDTALQRFRRFRPLIWLQRLLHTLFYLLHRHSAQPRCSPYATRSWVQGPASVIQQLQHFSSVNAAAAAELKVTFSRLRIAAPSKRCCCDTDILPFEGHVCSTVVPKPNGKCPETNLGRGVSQTHSANRSGSACPEGSDVRNDANDTTWTGDEMGTQIVKELKLQPGSVASDALLAFRVLSGCSAGRWKLGLTCSSWRPLFLCSAREACVESMCQCAETSCVDIAEGRCLPMGEQHALTALGRIASAAVEDERDISALLTDPLCRQQQRAHDMYSQEKDLSLGFRTGNVCL